MSESGKPVLNDKGEWVIPGSRRPDGTYRKERVVKEGYIPPDEVKAYTSVGSRAKTGKQSIPGLAPSPAKVTNVETPKLAPKPHAVKDTKKPEPTEHPNSSHSIESASQKFAEIALSPSTDVDPEISKDKKIKALKKKLRQIEEICEKLARKEDITSEQMEKISKRAEIEREIRSLET